MTVLPNPISIIGGGLSGLVLARCLLRHRIPSIVYEQESEDRARRSSRHNYGVTLQNETLASLIPDPTARTTVLVGSGRVSSSYYTAGTPRSGQRVHLHRLEELLRQGLDIKYNCEVLRVEMPATAERTNTWPTLHFTQGEPVRTSNYVVAADGVHSRLRKHLLPKVELSILPFVVFRSKRMVPWDTFQKLYAPAFNGETVISLSVPNPTAHLETLCLRVALLSGDETKGQDVAMEYTYSRKARTGSLDKLYTPNRGLADASAIPEEYYEELAALNEFGEIGQAFRECFDAEKVRQDRTLQWLMREVLVGPEDAANALREFRTIFIGDALHAFPILGGDGGDMAVQDAMVLVQSMDIGNISDGKGGWDSLYTEYCGRRMTTWEGGLNQAKANLTSMH